MLQTEQKLKDNKSSKTTWKGPITKYGLGWCIGSWNGQKVVSHQGQSTGGRATMVGFKDDKFVCVILANTDVLRFHQIPFRIHDFFL